MTITGNIVKFTNMVLMHNLIPHFIYEQYEAGNTHGRFQAVTLFLDISQFSTMTQSLMDYGKEGAEVLADMINRIFEPTINAVYEQGGFITGFAGDAFTAVFPHHNPATAYAAYTAAHSIRQTFVNMGQQQTKLGNFTIKVKQGLSAGEVDWGIVGSDDHKTYFFRGEAIDDCAKAKNQAGEMDIIIDKQIQALLGQTAVSIFARTHHHAHLLNSNPQTILPTTTPPTVGYQFFPKTVWQNRQPNEFRDVATIFVSFQGSPDFADMSHFISQTITLVDQFEGYFVEIDFGDKGGLFLVYFGAPIAHENDVERALSFILAMQTELASSAIQWRAGISFGTVYAGYIGIPRRDKYTCMGSVVNFSARLMMQAEWGQVLVSKPVALHPSFDFISLGHISYKGYSRPELTYLLKDKNVAQQVFQQKMIGRERELEKLVTFTHHLFVEHKNSVSIIYGEAGMGKSYLAYTLGQKLGGQARWMMGQCDPILQKSFNPFIYFLKKYFGQVVGSTETKNKARFNHRLNDLLTDLVDFDNLRELCDEINRTRSFLGALLDLHWSDSLYEQIDAKGRYENTITAISTLLQAECRRQPVILEIENGHWMDKASHELLTILSRQTRENPLLIIITSRYADDGSRPDYDIDKSTPTLNLDLTALTAVSIQKLAQEVLNTPISTTLQTILVEKAEANPLFVQQILYYLQEEGALQISEVDGTLISTLPTDAFELPSTINALLVGRLDRLTQPVKEAIQTAAVLGHEFESHLLSKMLNRDLSTELEIAEKEQIWTQLNARQYTFKHILLRDAAYEMQLRGRLRDLHYLAAITGEQLHSWELSDYNNLLAYHYEMAYTLGKNDAKAKAHHYLQQTGNTALANYENRQAVDYFSRSLALTEADDNEARYHLLMAREKAYNLLGERDTQAEDINSLAHLTLPTTLGEQITNEWKQRQAVTLCRQADYAVVTSNFEMAIIFTDMATQVAKSVADLITQARAQYIWGQALEHQGLYSAAQERFEMGVTVAKQTITHSTTAKLPMLSVLADNLKGLGSVAHRSGNYAEAQTYYEEALAIYEGGDDQHGVSGCLRNLGNIDWYLGNYANAQTHYEQALAGYQQIGDQHGVGACLNNLGNTALHLGNYAGAQGHYEQSLSIQQAIGNRRGQGVLRNNLGIVAEMRENFDQALMYYEQAWMISQETSDQQSASNALNNLGGIANILGDYMKANAYYQQALVIKQEIGDRQGEGLSLSNLGDIAHNLGDYAKAQAYFEKALAISQEIGDRRGQSLYQSNLGLIFYGQGKKTQQACQYIQQAVDLVRELKMEKYLATTLTHLGHVLLEQGELNLAQAAYREAHDWYHEARSGSLRMMPLAGLAAVALAQNDLTTALCHVESILDYLTKYNLNGYLYPFLVHLRCVQVLQATGDVRRTKVVLARAQGLLQAQAAKIPEGIMREQFLAERVNHTLLGLQIKSLS